MARRASRANYMFLSRRIRALSKDVRQSETKRRLAFPSAVPGSHRAREQASPLRSRRCARSFGSQTRPTSQRCTLLGRVRKRHAKTSHRASGVPSQEGSMSSSRQSSRRSARSRGKTEARDEGPSSSHSKPLSPNPKSPPMNLSTIVEKSPPSRAVKTGSPSPTKSAEIKELRRQLEAAQRKVEQMEARLGPPGSPDSRAGSPDRARRVAEEGALNRAVVLVQMRSERPPGKRWPTPSAS